MGSSANGGRGQKRLHEPLSRLAVNECESRVSPKSGEEERELLGPIGEQVAGLGNALV